jgi:hypothetical protein
LLHAIPLLCGSFCIFIPVSVRVKM